MWRGGGMIMMRSPKPSDLQGIKNEAASASSDLDWKIQVVVFYTWGLLQFLILRLWHTPSSRAKNSLPIVLGVWIIFWFLWSLWTIKCCISHCGPTPNGQKFVGMFSCYIIALSLFCMATPSSSPLTPIHLGWLLQLSHVPHFLPFWCRPPRLCSCSEFSGVCVATLLASARHNTCAIQQRHSFDVRGSKHPRDSSIYLLPLLSIHYYCWPFSFRSWVFGGFKRWTSSLPK